MNRTIVPFLLSLCLVSKGWAQDFAARVDHSSWEVQLGRLSCSLEHEIPGFGKAVFSRDAGRGQKFLLRANERQPARDMKVYAYSPKWYQEKTVKRLVSFRTLPGLKPVSFYKKTPGEMLGYLQQGLQVRFVSHEPSEHRVILEPAAFMGAYREYKHCVKDLVPLAFEDLRKSNVYFESASIRIKPGDRELLDAIADTVMNDPDITRVHITGHSDTLGSYRDNRDYALKRMWKVKDYLVFSGVNQDIITQKGHADTRPIATNRTVEGRSKNRRVEIILYR